MRYTIHIICCIAGMYLLPACDKRHDLAIPDFTVATDKTSYKVGESIQFNLSGNPDMLTFYSGEVGKRQEFSGRATASGTPKLQFTSLAANGTQANSLAIMVSGNFAGAGATEAESAANIVAATWTDITNRATLSTGTSVSSGAINLSDVAVADKPIYIAFKYRGDAGSIQRKWTITGLTVTNILSDATMYTIANLTNAAINNYGVSTTFSPGWLAAKVTNTFGWTISSGNSLVITGATTAVAATAASEAWTYCGPLVLNRVTPDIGTVIKNITARLDFYSYTYSTPGTYTATLEGTTNNTYGKEKVVRTIPISITP